MELRLGKKSTRQLENLVEPSQFTVLALELNHMLRLCCNNAVANDGICLYARDFIVCLRHAAQVGGYRFDVRPQRGVAG